jgi:N-acyl-phosphatidylethanolamine-hydrolysing phospholipase D
MTGQAGAGTKRPSSAAALCALGLALALLALAPAPLMGDAGTGDDSRLRLEFPRAPRRDGTYRNLDPEFRRASHWTRVRVYLLSLAALVKAEHPFVALPIAVPDLTTLRQNRHQPTVTWIGHSTLLVQLDGVTFLTDPIWSNRSGPFSGTVGVRRFTPPGIPFDRLPPIDLVLISHDHYDHLDEPTVRRLARAFNPRFVVPLGIKSWLQDRGITNVSELDWGESISFKELQIVCTPAQHGSGRTLTDGGYRLWSSWAVIGSKRFYFAGDTGYAPHFEMIGRILGPFDLAALPIGSYSPRFIAKPIHTSPEDALQAMRDLRAAKFIGIHWGTFELAHEPYDEPPRRIADEVARLGLDPRSILLPKPGEVLPW